MAKTAKNSVKLSSWEKTHLRQLALVDKKIAAAFDELCKKAGVIGALNAGKVSPDKAFSLSDYPDINKQIDNALRELSRSMQVAIVDGVRSQWSLADDKNDALCEQVLGSPRGKLPDALQKRYFAARNTEAVDAFIKRKEGGLNLSQRVWKYAAEARVDIESALEIGIKSGQPASAIARDLKQYLKEPDKLFRRVRDKDGVLHLSSRAKEYHPGQGVYRSSYKNALRLAATECNMAYRESDYERWQQLDFVVGIEVKLSNNHTLNGHPFTDICDDLAGRYPKDFKFRGWHPFCRCHAVSILKTNEEIMADNKRILEGKEPLETSVNSVTEMPEGFKQWLEDNKDRILAADKRGTLPYFIRDNSKHIGVQSRYGAVGAVTGTKLGRTATKAAFKEYDNAPAPTLTPEVQQNTQSIASDFGIKTPPKPMRFIDADQGRANVSYGKSEEFSLNCQATVAVHEARLRGLNVTALGYNSAQGSVSYELGEHFEAIWQHPKTGKTPMPTTLRASSFDDLLGKVEAQTKAVGRYHIGINMSENRGHVITAERLSNGKMMYYDAQNGVFLKLEEYTVSGVEYFEVLKVDKLLLRPDIFKQIARWL